MVLVSHPVPTLLYAHHYYCTIAECNDKLVETRSWMQDHCGSCIFYSDRTDLEYTASSISETLHGSSSTQAIGTIFLVIN